ncbi:MAG: RsmG family class I SAM-dependent methyltransferase, partial [Actinomycetota bacterium]
AIAIPETQFTLVDRSDRRIDLLRRVIRVLGLQNCQPLRGDINDLEGPVEAIVSRASMPAEQLGGIVTRHLSPGGVAVTGGSWRERPEVRGWDTVEIPEDVLDQTVWLLIMRRE